MKVLMISKALVIGTYHRKIEELANMGVRIDLVIPEQWGGTPPEINSALNYSIHQLPVHFSGKNHFHVYSGLSSLMELVNPDLVHIDEEPYSLVTYQAARLAVQNSIPCLWFTWQNILKRYPWPFSAIERFTYRVVSAGLAGTEQAAQVLLRKGFRKPLFIIPQFGVDPETFRRVDVSDIKQKLFGSIDTKVIGYVGRLVEEKGLIALLEAFSRIPHAPSLLLLGDGPEKDRIQRQAKILGITERTVVLDSVPSCEIPSYLSLLDCLVLPSLTRKNWKEQFGRVLIEAMACEVPVIGSDSGEIPRVIGDAGLIFREGDVEELADGLGRVVSDEHFRLSLRKRGLLRVHDHFTQRIIAKETVRVYETILRGGKV